MGTDPIISGVLSYGAPGLIIAALCVVIKSLWTAYQTSQEARIKEGAESVKIISANTAVMDRQASMMADMRRTMEAVADAIRISRNTNPNR